MIKRNRNGKLEVNTLDVSVAMDNFFMLVNFKDKEEVEWLYEQLQGYLEQSYEDTIADFD